LIKPLLVGLAVREILAPWTGHPWDFEIFVRLGAFLQSGASPYSLLPYLPGLSFAPYSTMTSISYPPLSAFIFALCYRIYVLLGSQSQFLYYFLLKQPVILSDVAVGLVLFKLASRGGDSQRALKVASVWLYFPFAIVVSAVWGALDPMALGLSLGALYLYTSGRRISSAAMLGLAIYLKLMPFVFLPLFLMQGTQSWKAKASFSSLAIAIPLLGTVLPVAAFHWGLTGVGSAVSYQASLPSFGGMSVMFALSFFGSVSGALAPITGFLWIPALLLCYVYAYAKKVELPKGMLIAILAFSVSRPSLPEQWALYPLALLLLLPDSKSWRHFVAVSSIASAFLIVNNLLLVRFFTPLSLSAFSWDQFADSASAFADIRYALLVGLAVIFFAEAFTVMTNRESLLLSKVRTMVALRPSELLAPVGYLSLVTLSGGLLDFSVTSMITDWKLAMESNVIFGLSWLSLYHIMLVITFEGFAVTVVLFSRKGVAASVDLLVRLTSLNVAAAGLSLILFRSLEGAPLISVTPIFLAGSAQVTERFFVVFTALICGLGLLFQREVGRVVLLIPERVARLSGAGRLESTP